MKKIQIKNTGGKGCILLRTILFFYPLTPVYATDGCTSQECGSTPSIDNCDVTQNTIFNTGVYSLANGVDICANNIVLDCNSSTLKGSEVDNSIGIFIRNRNNVTVIRCNVNNYTNGIELFNSTDSNISGNNLFFSRFGLFAHDSSNNNTILNNVASNNLLGITVEFSSKHNLVKNNSV